MNAYQVFPTPLLLDVQMRGWSMSRHFFISVLGQRPSKGGAIRPVTSQEHIHARPEQGWTKNTGNNYAKLKKWAIIKQSELLGKRSFMVYKELQA